eukprot:1870539-Rhodomonas_salina.3
MVGELMGNKSVGGNPTLFCRFAVPSWHQAITQCEHVDGPFCGRHWRGEEEVPSCQIDGGPRQADPRQ